jgi:hypothetical protein
MEPPKISDLQQRTDLAAGRPRLRRHVRHPLDGGVEARPLLDGGHGDGGGACEIGSATIQLGSCSIYIANAVRLDPVLAATDAATNA